MYINDEWRGKTPLELKYLDIGDYFIHMSTDGYLAYDTKYTVQYNKENVLNKKKIEHINFTKLMLEKKIKYNPDIYAVNDPGSHLKEEYQSKFLLEKIIQAIQK